MSLNKKYMEEYRQWTSEEPTYTKNGATFHTLKYVDFLEGRLRAMEEQRADNTGSPKLPPFNEEILPEIKLFFDGDISAREVNAAMCCFRIIERQLRAGA